MPSLKSLLRRGTTGRFEVAQYHDITSTTDSHSTSNADDPPRQDLVFPEAFPTKQSRARRNFNKVTSFLLTNVFMSMLLMLLGVGVSVGLGAYTLFSVEPSIIIDKSVKAFAIPNHEVTRNYDALKTAEDNWQEYRRKNRYKRDNVYIEAINDKNQIRPVSRKEFKSFIDIHLHDVFYREEDYSSSSKSRSKRQADGKPKRINYVTQSNRKWKMQLVYMAEGEENPGNIFTPDRIARVQEAEWAVRNRSGYSDYCYIDYFLIQTDPFLQQVDGCAPLNSLMTYFYPSRMPDGTVKFDGLGKRQENIENTIDYAMQYDTFYWYVDSQMDAGNKKSAFLRTEVPFGAPLLGKTRW